MMQILFSRVSSAVLSVSVSGSKSKWLMHRELRISGLSEPDSTQNPKDSPLIRKKIVSSKTRKKALGGEEEKAMRSCLCVLEGGLLRSSCGFPYLFLVAFEAGSIIRAFLLLIAYPFALACRFLVSDSLSNQILVFIALCGLKVSSVESVARAVLPKFYLEDLRWESYKELLSCQRRFVVALDSPVLMIEPFLKEFLEVEQIFGIEIHTTRNGTCSGLVKSRLEALPAADLGISSSSDQSLINNRCKETLAVKAPAPVPRQRYLKPLVFHDGRIAVRPTPIMALAIFLWLPLGITLAIPRTLILVLCPNIPLIIACEAALGIAVRYKGNPTRGTEYTRGNLYVCSHRTLMDPVFLSGVVCRRVTAMTYSISWLTEILSPIRTVRLTRCRFQDAGTISSHLRKGDLIVCPEGTTCREPYLLRFSKLFVEIARTVVPVAMRCEVQLFHGTSVRGWKAMDPFFFALNPRPVYHVELLERIDLRQLAEARGMSSFEIANEIQRRIADALGFECTGYTRKDKYRILGGSIKNILHHENRF